MCYRRSPNWAKRSSPRRNNSLTTRTLKINIIAPLHAERNKTQRSKDKQEDETPKYLGLACHTSRYCCSSLMTIRAGRVPWVVNYLVDCCRLSCTIIDCFLLHAIRIELYVHGIGLHVHGIWLYKRSRRRRVDGWRLVELLRSIKWIIL